MLADGTRYSGVAFGAFPSSNNLATGEVVFNTAMTGYQEVISDPSYRGQIVCFTYPLIGNYGINSQDAESRSIFLSGIIVKELSRIVSNWRSQQTLDAYLKKHNVPGIAGIDTRALTLRLRNQGAMSGLITTKNLSRAREREILKRSGSIVGKDLVSQVTLKELYRWNNSGKHRVVAIDTGIKHNILRILEELGCKITVMPPSSSLVAILKERPAGVFLSNGPGDPSAVSYLINTVKGLIGKVPIFGICMGHQILAQALGAKTIKLPFGHHGANHPVLNIKTGKVEITSQNHGFSVDAQSLPKELELTHLNLNDKTCEGLAHSRLPVYSVQYHPEAAPGPHDSRYLFNKFIMQMEKTNYRATSSA